MGGLADNRGWWGKSSVIEGACEGAGWRRELPKGHGLGLAFCYSFLSHTAAVVEVAVDDKGAVRVW